MSDSSILTGVMQDIGGTYSSDTLDALLLWAESEGVPESWNNPLATTLSCCGGTDVNSVGVKQYPTVNDGIKATYDTLTGGGYSAVVSAIRNNKSWTDIWQAVNASPWCSGCQGGRYPIALYNALSSAPHRPPPPPGGGGGTPPPPHEAPAGISGAVLAAWSTLKTRTGSDATKQLNTLAGYQAILREARK